LQIGRRSVVALAIFATPTAGIPCRPHSFASSPSRMAPSESE
jgi:hypothetical protein